MARIESGFPGERLVVVPQPFLDLMQDNPLTGDLYVHSLGHVAHAQYHHVEGRGTPGRHTFLYCTWGRGMIRVGEVEFALLTNQFVVIPPGAPHSYRADADDPWTLYWIVFEGVKAPLFTRGMESPRDASPSVRSRQEERTELFESMYATLCGSLTLEKLNYANILLGHLLAAFLYIGLLEEPAPGQAGHAEGMVARVTHFMTDNIERNLTLRQIASHAGYSESYFYRRFIRETGHAPVDYFIRMKINKAAVYLLKTTMSVSQIAAKLGFRSPDYFSRTFRRIVGITATDFRRQGFKL